MQTPVLTCGHASIDWAAEGNEMDALDFFAQCCGLGMLCSSVLLFDVRNSFGLSQSYIWISGTLRFIAIVLVPGNSYVSYMVLVYNIGCKMSCSYNVQYLANAISP